MRSSLLLLIVMEILWNCRETFSKNYSVFKRLEEGTTDAYFFTFSIPSITLLTSISIMQRKCPLGQRSRPIVVQGRQGSSATSITIERVPYGAKPNSCTVEPNSATTGRFRADAICAIAESFVTTTSQLSSAAAVCSHDVFPAKFNRVVDGSVSPNVVSSVIPATIPSAIVWQSCCSSGEPNSTIRAW